MSDEFEPAVEDLDLATVLAALADPVRLATVRTLAREQAEMRCSVLREVSGCDVTKSTMSHHFKVLREAGITHTRVSGVSRYTTLRRDDLEAAFPGLVDAVVGELSNAVSARAGSAGANR